MISLNTPITMLTSLSKKLLLTNLVRVVNNISLFSDGTRTPTRVRVRSATVLALALGLAPHVASVGDCLLSVGLPVSDNSLPELYCIVADKYIEFRKRLPPCIDSKGLNLMTWNPTSLQSEATASGWKTHDLQQLLNSHILALQETKLGSDDALRAELGLTGARMYHSPAVVAHSKPSGGVAVILPTYLGCVDAVKTEVVPGYVVAVTMRLRDLPLHVLSVYFQPGNEFKLLKKLRRHLDSLSGTGAAVILMADINRLRGDEQWPAFLQAYELTEVTCSEGIPLLTHQSHSCWSALDVICVSASLLDTHHWQAKASLKPRRDGKLGHAQVFATCRPPKAAQKSPLPNYFRLPDDVFTCNSAPTRCISALLRHYLSRSQGLSPCSKLLEMNAFFKAFATTFPSRPPTDPAYVLRKRCSASKCTLAVTEDTIHSLNQKTRLQVDIANLSVRSDGRLHISRRLRDTWLEALNDYESLQRQISDCCSLRASLLGKPVSLKVWERFRMLSPKSTGTLTRLYDKQGCLQIDLQKIASTVLQGREFWTQHPSHVDLREMEALAQFVPVRHHPPELTFPDLQLFRDALATAPNTSPGLDGVPYSAYRTAHDVSAQILRDFFLAVVEGSVQCTPTQLLVWIPKAVEGLYPDNWRPLSMPQVYDRIIDKVMFAFLFTWFSSVLHPSQSLLSIIKEPQFNFFEAQKFLNSAEEFAATLLIDLSKAFERVNLKWLTYLLQRYNAPAFVQRYFEWTFSNRVSIAKVAGHLTEPIKPVVGLDMGRACSVLLFCLSIDPLFWHIHSLRLQVQRAYMDDTTLAANGTQWIAQVQNAFSLFEKVGLVVEKHDCCIFVDADTMECTPACSSWAQAAALALSLPGTRFKVASSNITFSQNELVALSKGESPALLCHLLTLPCKCKAKTTIIPSVQVTSEQLTFIDNTPYGAKIIKAHDITLGLPLASRVTNVLPFDSEGQISKPGKQRLAGLLDIALTRAINKITVRARRLCHTATSAPKRALFWTAYCQSTLYFATSVFALTPKYLAVLNRLQQKVLLGRPWIPGKHLATTFSMLKIGPCCAISIACRKANLAAVLRLYGTRILQTKEPKAKMLKTAHQSLQDWLRLEPESFRKCFRTIYEPDASRARKKNINRITAEFCRVRKQQERRQATHHLLIKASKSAFAIYSESSLESIFQALQTFPAKLVQPVNRYYFLRWLVAEETDAQFYQRLQGIKREQQCVCGCSRQARRHLFSTHFGSVCHEEYTKRAGEMPWVALMPQQARDLLASELEIDELPQGPLRNTWLGLLSQTPQLMLRECPLCLLGEASVEHWLTTCPVIGYVLSCAAKHLHTLAGLDCMQQGRVCYKLINRIADIRRHVYTKGALGKHYAETTSAELHDRLQRIEETQYLEHFRIACNELQQALHRAPGADNVEVPPDVTTECCPALNQKNLGIRTSALLASFPRANQYKNVPTVLSKVALAEFQDIAVCPGHSVLLPALSMARTGAAVKIQDYSCHCGNTHYKLTTSEPIRPGDSLRLEAASLPVVSPPYLLIQTDGSFITRKGQGFGGAGLIFWKCSGQGPPVALVFLGIELPTSSDSMHSEATAFYQAGLYLLQHGDALRLQHFPETLNKNLHVYFQLDNQPLVRYLNNTAKCLHRCAAELCSQMRARLAVKYGHTVYEYIPRESNQFADFAAGIASDALACRADTPEFGYHLNNINVDQHVHKVPLPQFDTLTPTVHLLRCQDAPLYMMERLGLAPRDARELLPLVFAHDAHRRDQALRYLRLLELQPMQSCSLQVTYHPSNGARLYANTPSAQHLARKARLLLFGLTHYEVDMVSAHFQIYLYAATGDNTFQGLTVAQIRHNLLLDLIASNRRAASMELVKKVFNVFLNSGLQQTLTLLQSLFFFAPPYAVQFFRMLNEARDRVLQFAISKGYVPVHTSDKNKMYFCLEYLEQKYVRKLLEHLTTECAFTSVIFLHDGFWCAPCPDKLVLQRAVQLASQALSIPPWPVQVTNLEVQWQQHFACHGLSNPAIPQLKTFAPKKRQVDTLQVLVKYRRTNASKQIVLHTTEQVGTLHRFFKRKFGDI